MIQPVVLAVLVTAAMGLFLAAVSLMLLRTVRGHGRRDHTSSKHTDPGRNASGTTTGQPPVSETSDGSALEAESSNTDGDVRSSDEHGGPSDGTPTPEA